jgi:hypothetical protein
VRRLERQLRTAQSRGHQRRLPEHGHRLGSDLGHHEPRVGGRPDVGHGERTSWMGNDRDAARWIRRFRVEPADGEVGRRRVNRRRGPCRRGHTTSPIRGRARRRRAGPRRPCRRLTAGYAETATPDPQVIFTPSGRRGPRPRRDHGARRRPVRSVSTSTRSAVAAASAGAAR